MAEMDIFDQDPFTLQSLTLSVNNLPVVPGVPEPQTWVLFALGLGALAIAAKRRAA